MDLEDRFVGELTLKERISYMVYREIFQQEKDDLRFKYDAGSEARKNELQFQITDLTQKIDIFDKDRY